MARAVVRGSLISAGLAGALCALAVQAAGDSFVVPGSKAEQLDSCVEPTEFMRRNHMEVIKHQRDETVHRGIRSSKHSLSGCVDCHVSHGESGEPIPVDAPGQFCQACHGFAAVHLNCFDCHATIPAYSDEQTAARLSRDGLAWHPPVTGASAGNVGLQPEVLGEGN